MGRILAREAPVDADLVLGVPDSGLPCAMGYAQESGIPYSDGIVKNRYVGRTFIEPTDEMRQMGIRIKLNPLPSVIAGKRLVVLDDSIVRGNTSRKLVDMLRDAGAREVHLRIVSRRSGGRVSTVSIPIPRISSSRRTWTTTRCATS